MATVHLWHAWHDPYPPDQLAPPPDPFRIPDWLAAIAALDAPPERRRTDSILLRTTKPEAQP